MPRLSLTNAQKKALRQWYRSQSTKPTHQACIKWFEAQYGRKISQSTVSDCLNNKYKYLDTSNDIESRRQRVAKWPILETILFEYQKLLESQGHATTGDILIERARHIWHQVPEYRELPEPHFSQGWLTRFKQRHGIHSHIQHGEAASVPITAVDEMKAVQTICGEYPEDAIYNMDETGLFWRNAVNYGLLTMPMPGRKQDKSRISLALCTNATGTDRLPIWFIGHAKQPRALKGLNFEALGCYWRNNKKAWMTTIIMVDWLRSFYRHIGDRSVILSMDNLKAHINGVELAPPPSNIHIIWLPKNSTSIFQPLDQGIIQNFKIHYRKQWIQYIIQSIDTGINPFTTITLNNTLHWCLHAWSYKVVNTTIYRCFRKSTIIKPVIDLPAPADLNIIPEYESLRERIADVMELAHILNPEGEDEVQDEEEVTLDTIIEQHIGTEIVDEEAILEDVEPPPRILPTLSQAVEAVRLLHLFQEHQDQTQHHDIRYLQRLEHHLCTQLGNSRSQSTIDRWIT